MTSKRCPACKTTKELTEFYRNAGQKDGLSCQCKVCCKAASMKWANEHPEKVKAIEQRARERRKSRAD